MSDIDIWDLIIGMWLQPLGLIVIHLSNNFLVQWFIGIPIILTGFQFHLYGTNFLNLRPSWWR